MRSRVHSLIIARRSLCPEKLESNPGQGSKGINLSGWHGLDMSITMTNQKNKINVILNQYTFHQWTHDESDI